MRSPAERLVKLLVAPGEAQPLDGGEWDRVVRVAARAGVLAQLGLRLAEHGVCIPSGPSRHMDAALRVARAHHGNVRWEVRRVQEALGSAGVGFVLLKGAAYVLGDLPVAAGRVFEDVDILVARQDLAAAECALTVHGWKTTHAHPYDQRYYREWMHELPPMRHVRRGSTLDVHHTLLPTTAALKPDAGKFWAARAPLSGWSGVHLPGDADITLHAAAHLFANGAFEHGLRDLLDLDGLFRHFGRDAAFWPRLAARAEEMDLTLPLGDATYWTRGVFGTPMPDAAAVFEEERYRSPGRGALRRFLFARGLEPNHPLCRSPGSGPARALLYARSHLLRMPAPLLAGHLTRKALRAGGQPT